ncbi:MAG: hypothetical protein R2874_08915 [Desulfobacterales bacterium]
MEYALSMFSQRKMVLVISNKPKEISEIVNKEFNMGSTLLNGVGGYSGAPETGRAHGDQQYSAQTAGRDHCYH